MDKDIERFLKMYRKASKERKEAAHKAYVEAYLESWPALDLPMAKRRAEERWKAMVR